MYPSPRFWLVGGPPSPWVADRETTGLELDVRTPRPTRSRVTRCWWQISWLAGRCLWPPSQERYPLPVARLAIDSPLTVAGAAAALGAQICARTAFPFDPLREPPPT